MSLGGVGSAISKVVSFTILGLLFKEKKQKDNIQRIGELSEQTAKEGEPRPIVWGRVRPISGNIMHSSTPRIETREVQGQSSGGGKGGSKKKEPKQYEERVFRTYAIRICEGPITAIIRVWRNNKLVYDARGNDWGAQNNGVFLSRARFYLGAWAQMPDPTLESIWGSGSVPGYRGTCYMVVPDEDLTDLGGAVPQYIFEVERAEGTYLTSRPYAVEDVESAKANGASLETGQKREALISVELSESISVLGATLQESSHRDTLFEIYDLESVAIFGCSLVGGSNQNTVEEIKDSEAVRMVGATLVGGVRRRGLIIYTDPEAEHVSAIGPTLIGGAHNAP